MATSTPTSGKRDLGSVGSPRFLSSMGFSDSAHLTSILKHHEAKSVIETTLRKSAGILSEFTENTIAQTNAYFNKILAPERFGFPSPNPVVRKEVSKERPRSASTNSNIPFNLARKKPDITKLPPSIVDILREDSNSSIPSIQKSKKYHYHSKKMALKHRDDPSSKVHVPLIPSRKNITPRIVLVSTPLSLPMKDNLRKDASTNLHEHEIAYHKGVSDIQHAATPMSAGMKNDKKKGGPVHASSVVRKPEKLNIGVDKGNAFILGSKSKSPYYNTFGDASVDSSGDKEPSNRKWVVNVGNLLDEQISLSLIANNLTITGFRLPSLNYPEGHSVSETITLPVEIDVHNLRIYRAKDARAFLVIQEKQ